MKIYLSKSGLANSAVFGLVKDQLLALGHQVIEFTSGTYNKDAILEADKLLIVPPERIIGFPNPGFSFSFSKNSSIGTYDLGMGQVNQIIHWVNKKEGESYEDIGGDDLSINSSDIYVLTYLHTDGSIKIDTISELTLDHNDAKKEWGYCSLNDESDSLEEAFGKGDFVSYQSSSSELMLATARLFNIKF